MAYKLQQAITKATKKLMSHTLYVEWLSRLNKVPKKLGFLSNCKEMHSERMGYSQKLEGFQKK